MLTLPRSKPPIVFSHNIKPEQMPGRLIWMARIAQEKCQPEVAKAIGVSRETIRLWEIGECSISEDKIEPLLIALNQSPNLLKHKALNISTPAFNPHKRMGRILWMTRIAQDKNRTELAHEINVCERRMIRLWETGERVIDGVMLGRLTKALNQDPRVFWS